MRLSVQDAGVGLDPESVDHCSRRSTPPRPRAWAWGSRSAAPSSRVIKGGCGRHRMMVREPRSRFLFPVDPRVWRAPAALAVFGATASDAGHAVAST